MQHHPQHLEERAGRGGGEKRPSIPFPEHVRLKKRSEIGFERIRATWAAEEDGGGGGIRRELFPSVVASFPFLKFISISREYMFDFSFSLPPLSLSRSLLSSSPRR